MTIEEQLKQRSNGSCELCGNTNDLVVYALPPERDLHADKSIYVCSTCSSQLDKKAPMDVAHWKCLNTSMWSEVPAVQVVSWRLLNRLRDESWASDALDMLYLDDEMLAWAKSMGDHESDGKAEDVHKDCNGAQLLDGDNVTLIKSLDVKGSQINAKIGTSVKNIKLVQDNTEQIEGKIEGQQIVILTKYVRKA